MDELREDKLLLTFVLLRFESAVVLLTFFFFWSVKRQLKKEEKRQILSVECHMNRALEKVS